jgi:hypothetical protein
MNNIESIKKEAVRDFRKKYPYLFAGTDDIEREIIDLISWAVEEHWDAVRGMTTASFPYFSNFSGNGNEDDAYSEGWDAAHPHGYNSAVFDSEKRHREFMGIPSPQRPEQADENKR